MRIGFFAPEAGGPTSIVSYALNLGRALEERGHQVIMPPEPVLNRPAHLSELLGFCKGLDILHFEIGAERLREFSFLRAFQDFQVSLPFSATIHHPERVIWNPTARISNRFPALFQWPHLLLANRGTYRLEKRTLHRTDAVIVLTQTGRERLRRNFSLPEDRIHYLPHGVRICPYQALPDFNCIRFISFGDLQRGKGFEDVLSAIHLLTREHPGLRSRLRFTIASEAHHRQARDYADELQGLSWKLGIHDLVSFRTCLAKDEIAPLIQSHHLMLLPDRELTGINFLGRRYGASSALAWSLGCGRGVIGSNAGALPEEIAHGIGEVYPQGNVRALASALDRILDRSDLIAAWGVEAYRLGQERCWTKAAERYEALFAGIGVGGSSGRT